MWPWVVAVVGMLRSGDLVSGACSATSLPGDRGSPPHLSLLFLTSCRWPLRGFEAGAGVVTWWCPAPAPRACTCVLASPAPSSARASGGAALGWGHVGTGAVL